MKPLTIAALALACAGCNEVVDIDRFRVVRDGAVEDAGPDDMDGGPRPDGAVDDGGRPDGGGGGGDACVPTTFYRDADEDGAGDPAVTMDACGAPTGYVANADDCDDGDGTIEPGATETCDGVDQDCDFTVDEGLMEVLGSPIPVVDDLGFTDGADAAIVAHADGVGIVWKREGVDQIRASFFGVDASPTATNVFVENTTGSTIRNLSAARFTSAGVDQVAFAWTEGDAVRGTMFSSSGAPGRDFEVSSLADPRGLTIAQIGNRLLLVWKEANEAWAASVEPTLGSTTAPISLGSLGPEGDLAGLSVSESASPFALVGLSIPDAGTPDGGTAPDGGVPFHARSRFFVARVRLVASGIAHDAAADLFDWDEGTRCAALGAEPCGVATWFVHGRPLTVDGAESLVIESLLAGSETAGTVSICAFRTNISAGRLTPSAACEALPASALFTLNVGTRGAVADAVIDTGTGYGFLELPLSERTVGSSGVVVPIGPVDGFSLLGGPLISMYRGRGALLGARSGSSSRDIDWVRVGCEP